MKHVYDVEYDVYHRDRGSREGYWCSDKISIVANGDIGRATSKAERIVLAQRMKPERDADSGRIFRYRPVRVRVTSISQARIISG